MAWNLGLRCFFSWSHGHDLHSRKNIKKETRKLKIYTYTVGWHLWGDSLCIWKNPRVRNMRKKSQEKIYQAEALLGWLLNLPTATGFPLKCRILMIRLRLLWWWLIEQWDKNIYLLWTRHIWLHIISYRLPEFQSSFNFFGALSVFMDVVYCIGCCTLIGASS